MWQWTLKTLDDRIIRHFRESHAPVAQLSMGTAVGLFWALTPLVGIQMILTTFTWFLFRSLGIKFNLVIALAWVWITNPLTMPFFYYAFYMTGFHAFQLFHVNLNPVNFALFETTLRQANNMNMMDGLFHWLRFMIHDLGWPMLLGSTIIGIPSALAGIPITTRLVNRFRTTQAHHHNMTLEEWEAHYVYHTDDGEHHDVRTGTEPGENAGKKSGKGKLEIKKAS